MMVSGSIVFSVVVFILLSFFYIRMKYREYDRRETEKEKIEFVKLKIDSAIAYFRKNYDRTVSDNVISKIDFCRKLISKRKLEEQSFLLERLFSMCYETGSRLRTNYDDVNYIVSPLNNITKELVDHHVRFLKDHIDEF